MNSSCLNSVFRALFMGWLMVALASCAKEKEAPQSHEIPFDEASRAKLSFEMSAVACGMSGGECPDHVGSLISFRQSGLQFFVGVCSMQLIAPNKVLTNFHCVPENLWLTKNCADNIELKFPKTATQPAENFKCSRIEAHSPISSFSKTTAIQPDWALLTFEGATQRTPVAISAEGVQGGQKLTVYPSYFEQDVLQIKGKSVPVWTGQVEKVSCESTMDNILSAFYFNSHSPLVIATCDKKIVNGNSGSGMHNQLGELVALGSFGLKDNLEESSSGLKLKRQIFGGTNLSCIENFNSELSDFCYFSPAAFEFELFSQLPFALSQEKSQEVSESKSQLSQDILWSDGGVELLELLGLDLYKISGVQNLTSEEFYLRAQSLPVSLLEFITDKITNRLFVKSPSCVRNTASNKFSFTVPLFEPSLLPFDVSEWGVIEYLPIENQPTLTLKLERVSHKGSSNYSLTLAAWSLQDSDLDKEELLLLQIQLDKLYDDFEASATACGDILLNQSETCQRKQRDWQALKEWGLKYDLAPNLFYNRYFFRKYKLDSLQLGSLPICEDAKAPEISVGD